MPERYPPDDPREWLNRARSNLALANTDPVSELYFEDLCYNAQQAAEKAIKAVCIEYAISYPYVHDLAALVTILMDNGVAVPDTVKESAKLTRFAVAMRYPRLHLPVREDEYRRAILIAETVVRWAERIIHEKRS